MQLDEDSAKKLVSGPYGKTLYEVAFGYTAPIAFVKGNKVLNNGTIFFLQCYEDTPILAITAGHVYLSYLEKKKADEKVQCKIMNLEFNLELRLIDYCEEIDIAIFSISAEEVYKINKKILQGSHREWPPKLPDEGKGVFFCGYPLYGRKEIVASTGQIEYESGAFISLAVANDVSDRNITIHFDKNYQTTNPFNLPLPPENPINGNGGISGAPLIALFESSNSKIITWQLAGVIYEESALGLLMARPAAFILPDGKLKKEA